MTRSRLRPDVGNAACASTTSSRYSDFDAGALGYDTKILSIPLLPTVILLFLPSHYQGFRHQRAHAWVPLYIAVSEARREWPYEGEN